MIVRIIQTVTTDICVDTLDEHTAIAMIVWQEGEAIESQYSEPKFEVLALENGNGSQP